MSRADFTALLAPPSDTPVVSFMTLETEEGREISEGSMFMSEVLAWKK